MKIGDNVRLVNDDDGFLDLINIGDTGTIFSLGDDDHDFSVCFDDPEMPDNDRFTLVKKEWIELV